MSNVDIDAAKELGLTRVQKYWRRAGQVEMELDWLHDWIPALATFVRHLRRVYDNKEVGQNISVRRDIDPEWVLFFFIVQLHRSIQYWKMDGKDISDATKLVKEHVRCSLEWGTSGQPRQDHIWIRGREPRNERKSWNGKLIVKLLLTVTVADPERFTLKGKPVIYTGAFVELYNWRNRGQVH